MSRPNQSKIMFKRKTSMDNKSNPLIDYERIQVEKELMAPAPPPQPPPLVVPPASGSPGKLRLKLSTAKISLRKNSQIPQKNLQANPIPDSVRRKSAPQLFTFSIAPKVDRSSENPPSTVPKIPGFELKSSIRRSRTLGLSNGARMGGQGLPNDDLQLQDSISEPSSSIAGGGSSTSPESILDNVLSGASSVSVQSSSSSSHASNATVAQTMKGKELLPKRLLSIKASPELRVSPPTPDTSQPKLEMLPRLLLEATARSEIYDASSPLARSRSPSLAISPAVSPAPSPSPSITLRPSTPPENTVIFTDDLKCGICLDVYTDPRTLHCLHSFCLQCLVSENFKDENTWEQEPSRSEDPSCYSLKSDMGGSSAELTATVSPARQRGSSFSLRRKKSMDPLEIRVRKS